MARTDTGPPNAGLRFEDIRERIRIVKAQMEALIAKDESSRSAYPPGTLPARITRQCAKELEALIVDLRVLESDCRLVPGAQTEPYGPVTRKNVL